MIFSFYKFLRSIVRKVRNIISTIFYRLVLKEMGKNSKIFYNFYSPKINNIIIGDYCLIDTNVKCFSEFSKGYLSIGNNVKINTGVILDYSGGLEIEDNVVISRDSYILTHSHGYDPNSKPIPKPLIIKSGAWLGARIIITENVSYIGKNSLIASGSVVTKNIEENTIVGGNPAKFIKAI